jgi:hypothetical protein
MCFNRDVMAAAGSNTGLVRLFLPGRAALHRTGKIARNVIGTVV